MAGCEMSLGGRPSQRQRRALATGGRPRDRLAAALLAQLAAGAINPGQLGIVQVFHDEGCPCINGQPMSACTCEIVEVGNPRLIEGDGS